MDQKPFYITTPIYYVNDKPHIGHAYTTIACDVMARFMRAAGHEVFFLTGTDEHGQKVAKSALAKNISPQQFTDQLSQNFRLLAEKLQISHTDFIRTTEERHHRAAQYFWQKILDAGYIYQDSYAGWYAVRDEAFYHEDELHEAQGQKIAPSGAVCEWVEEPSYFFKLSAFQDKLLELYEQNPDFIQPATRRNEVMSFVKGGLQDLSISRSSFSWGVTVPNDQNHVMYVWLDALTNYLTALGYPDENSRNFQKFWPSDIHVVGKDILRFHAVYWPAFLLAAGLPVPRKVFAHGWWTIEGQKMSKSLGNVVDPFEMIEEFGLDQIRYFLLREVPFGKDGDFSHQAIISRINSQLANDLGNLAQRTLSLIAKNCEGKVPEVGELTAEDQNLLAQVQALYPQIEKHMQDMAFHKSFDCIWECCSAANAYIDHQAPWALKKTDISRMHTVLYVLVESLRHFALLLQPVMPESMGKMLDQLAVPLCQRNFSALTEHPLEAGISLPAPKAIFPRIVPATQEAI